MYEALHIETNGEVITKVPLGITVWRGIDVNDTTPLIIKVKESITNEHRLIEVDEQLNQKLLFTALHTKEKPQPQMFTSERSFEESSFEYRYVVVEDGILQKQLIKNSWRNELVVQ